MPPEPIKTREQFLAALRGIPAREEPFPGYPDPTESTADYALWHVLLDRLHEALAAADWTSFRALAGLYDAVERAGPSSEMYEASYVAFIEDVRLPAGRGELAAFFAHAPPTFARHLTRDRGLRNDGTGPKRRNR